MKNKIFIYLFLFTLLFVILQYMNEKRIFESQEAEIENLKGKVRQYHDSIIALETEIRDTDYFGFLGNDAAMTYFENMGFEASQVQALVSGKIYDSNLHSGNNPLVPLEGMNGPMKINKLEFLNHKWVQADFTDGKYWGEMILEYTFNNEKELKLNVISSFLYPN